MASEKDLQVKRSQPWVANPFYFVTARSNRPTGKLCWNKYISLEQKSALRQNIRGLRRKTSHELELERLRYEAEQDVAAKLPADQSAKADMPSWLRQYQRDQAAQRPPTSVHGGRHPPTLRMANVVADETQRLGSSQHGNSAHITFAADLDGLQERSLTIKEDVEPSLQYRSSASTFHLEQRKDEAGRSKRSSVVQSLSDAIRAARSSAAKLKDAIQSISQDDLPRSLEHVQAGRRFAKDKRLFKHDRRRAYLERADAMLKELQRKSAARKLDSLEGQLEKQQVRHLQLKHEGRRRLGSFEPVADQSSEERPTLTLPEPPQETARPIRQHWVPNSRATPSFCRLVGPAVAPGSDGNEDLLEQRWLDDHLDALQSQLSLEDDRAAFKDKSVTSKVLGSGELILWQERELWEVRQQGHYLRDAGRLLEAGHFAKDAHVEVAVLPPPRRPKVCTEDTVTQMARPKAWGMVEAIDSKYHGPDWVAESAILPSDSRVTRPPVCLQCGTTSFLAEICASLPFQASIPVCSSCSRRCWQGHQPERSWPNPWKDSAKSVALAQSEFFTDTTSPDIDLYVSSRRM